MLPSNLRDLIFLFFFGGVNLSASRILQVIDEDVVHARVPFIARTQQCFAVKAGIDGLLDVARRTFCDTSEGITSDVCMGSYRSRGTSFNC